MLVVITNSISIPGGIIIYYFNTSIYCAKYQLSNLINYSSVLEKQHASSLK